MQPIDRDVLSAQALVIDPNATSRSVLVQHLRDFGFADVRQSGRLTDARPLLEHRQFDVVVCEYHFDHSHTTGQDLLDELRREQLLPYSTVFVMVTGEATYQTVAEAAEAALDSFLIKPYSGNTLYERIKEARQRKRTLGDIYKAISDGRHEDAAQLCRQRFEQRQLYWLYAARIGAELQLMLGRTADARKMYDAVIAAKTVPWAKLGVARVQLAEGDLGRARRTLEALMASNPQYADSYEVMGKVQMEQGQFGEALDTYKTAATMTPGCLMRLQHCGTLAFYGQQPALAIEMLERAWVLGSKSRLYDVLSMALLAMLRFDGGDHKALAVCADVMLKFSERHPESLRLRRMATLGEALADLLAGRTATGLSRARALASGAEQPDFDLEVAANVLSLFSRLAAHGVAEAEYRDIVERVARRFCVSKVTTELLLAAVQREERACGWIRDIQAEILHRSESAMNHAMRGQPRMAVEQLLEAAQSTGNAKLVELAGAVAQRHRERIDDVAGLLERAEALSSKYCMPATHIAGVRRSSRSAGGLVLARASAEAAKSAAPAMVA